MVGTSVHFVGDLVVGCLAGLLLGLFFGLFVFVGWRVELVIGFHLSLVAGARWWWPLGLDRFWECFAYGFPIAKSY